MKKFFYSVAAVAALSVLAGCVKEAAQPELQDQTPSIVSFQVNLPSSLTKAWGDGNTVDELYVGVYSADGATFYDKVSTTTAPVAINNGSATFQVSLVKGLSYKVAFWAQKGGNTVAQGVPAYTVNLAGKTITANYPTSANTYSALSNNEAWDAFYAVVLVENVQAQVSESVTLSRPLAQINVLASDADVAAAALLGATFATSAVTVSNVPTQLNLLSGELGETRVNAVFSPAACTGESFKEGYKYVAMNYVFAAAQESNKSVTIGVDLTTSQNSFTVANVPVKPNYRTNIMGNIFTSAAAFEVEVAPAFQGNNDVEISEGPEVTGISVKTPPTNTTYYYGEMDEVAFRTGGLEVIKTYSNAQTEVIPVADLEFSDIELVEGDQDVTISWGGFETTQEITLVEGTGVGATDMSSDWWTAFSGYYDVAPDVETEIAMDLYAESPLQANWYTPVLVLSNKERGADGYAEYAALRLDNFGWGDGYVDIEANKESNWNWETFVTSTNNSVLEVSINYTTAGVATVRFDITYANGETHYQLYKNITVTSGAVKAFITCQKSYAVLHGDAPEVPEVATIASIAVTTPPTVTSYYHGAMTSLAFRTGGMVVTATYTDETTAPVALTDLNISDITMTDGDQNITIALKDDANIKTTQKITLAEGTGIGLTDFTTPFWTAFSDDYTIGTTDAVTIPTDVYTSSPAVENFHAPLVVLHNSIERGADGYTEYAALRLDNFGWGTAWDACTKDSNWNWDTLKAGLNNSVITITISCTTEGKATVRFDMVYANGETHYQEYSNIAVTAGDLKAFVTCEGSYVVLH